MASRLPAMRAPRTLVAAAQATTTPRLEDVAGLLSLNPCFAV